MGDCKAEDWQVLNNYSGENKFYFSPFITQLTAKSVRERMDHLFNNPDMSDLTIAATDPSWSWGQTSQEFIVR